MNINDEKARAEQIIRAWCLDLSNSVKQQDLDSHMRLVSERVQVYGMPKTSTINYKEWKLRRQYEFNNNEILALNFIKTRLINCTQKRLRFHTDQTMLGKDGMMVRLDKNITLELEDDMIWRVVEEKINSWKVQHLDMSRFQQNTA